MASENEPPISETRRLAVVAFADVAGFSRLMAEDDVWTSNQWKSLREELLLPLLKQYDGRLVETVGDAILVEFSSVVAALKWAVDAQKKPHPEAQRGTRENLQLRIAVNVEDVLVSHGNILGDGVNIASRIHDAAAPGQIVATGLVRELAGSKINVRFRDIGTPRLKNINRVIHLFQVVPLETSSSESASLHQPFIEWTSRPTVAVLPFRASSGHEMEEYFGSGITEDIISGLSRSHAFHVIARASTLRFANRSIDLQEIAAQLGVNYVMDGNVRRQGNRLRITAELVDVALNRSIWSESFDGTAEDLFDFQDTIVAAVVGSFEPRLNAHGIERVRNRSTHSLDAYDCVLKAASELYRFTDEGYHQSGIALQRAMELDPTYARAYAYSAWRLNYLVGEERSNNPERDKLLAVEHARHSIALDPDDPFCQVVAGHLTSLIEGDPHQAMSMFDLALSLDQNNALGWATSGVTLSYLGRRDEAIPRFQNAFKLSPFDTLNFTWWTGVGIAEFSSGNYAEAISWLQKARQVNSRFIATLRILAASLAMNGQEEKARAVGAEILRLDKDFSVDRFVSWYPFVRREDKLALKSGLFIAGLPR
ncbi:adenylate/guanylate cyclase domain-containing protein [Ruegeria conchae]|uniref:TolB-like protein n=1 Tax=Ruegeria conchae TaxID=981384 RepID=A0A497YTF7_9RHOB|nr:adenylate/guanylate cyclase domain-containing protein [Ruegeria conchae]RLJ97932.1 TolB-like protein [Ruegeria conchae]UWR02336.1 adenylate/guanylate cyclase domain-containing protein [Ruegeria conchae]